MIAATILVLAVTAPSPGAAGDGSAEGFSAVANFATAIDGGRAAEAASMLGTELVPDAAARQAWIEQFAAFESMAISEIGAVEGAMAGCERFRVSFSVRMKPESGNAVIPYFGWDSNPAIRWLTVCREEGEWRVTAIDTGP